MYKKRVSNQSTNRGAMVRGVIAIVSVLLLVGGTVGEGATAARAAFQCSYSLAFDGQLVAKEGGEFSVGVIAGVGCSWTATSNDSWITITAGSSGSGNGTVEYTVDENTGSSLRVGTMTIAEIEFTVFQNGTTPNCDFMTISPKTRTVSASGGSFNFSITGATQTECSWSASSDSAWLTITSGSSGTGNATVTYSVAANGTGSQRTGRITVSGSGVSKVHSVKQNP